MFGPRLLSRTKEPKKSLLMEFKINWRGFLVIKLQLSLLNNKKELGKNKGDKKSILICDF